MTASGIAAARAGGRMEDHPAPHRDRVPVGRMWYAVFGAPLAWSVQELYGYAGLSHGCFPRRVPLAHLAASGWWWSALGVGIAALAVGGGSLALSVWAWRRTRSEKGGDRMDTLEVGEGRTRFMAMSGILLSGVFLIAILFTGAALLGAPPCGR